MLHRTYLEHKTYNFLSRTGPQTKDLQLHIYLNVFIYMFPWVLKTFISVFVVSCTSVTKCSLINLRFSHFVKHVMKYP